MCSDVAMAMLMDGKMIDECPWIYYYYIAGYTASSDTHLDTTHKLLLC